MIDVRGNLSFQKGRHVATGTKRTERHVNDIQEN